MISHFKIFIFFYWIYLYERKETIKDHMKNILAENLLRFGVKNLSESTIKRLTEAMKVSPAGSYKTQINSTTIGTVTFSIKDKTLSLTSNGSLVGQWTINDDIANGPLTWKAGTDAASKAFDANGSITTAGRDSTIMVGLDKSFLTALNETLDAQAKVPNSPWNVPMKNSKNPKATYPTYIQSLKAKLAGGLKGQANGGIRTALSVMQNMKVGNASVRMNLQYSPADSEYMVYLAPGMGGTGLKYQQGGTFDKDMSTAINNAITKLANYNRTIITTTSCKRCCHENGCIS